MSGSANSGMAEAFEEAIEAIYLASASPSAWPAALDAIASCTNDVGTVLIYIRDDGTVSTASLRRCSRSTGTDGRCT